MTIGFRQHFPWTLLPYPAAVELDEAAEDRNSAIAEANYRWTRRTPERSRNAVAHALRRIGWIVPCPFDLDMDPVPTLEVKLPDDTAQHEPFKAETGIGALGNRHSSSTIAFDRPHPWLNMTRHIRTEDDLGTRGLLPGQGYPKELILTVGDGYAGFVLGWEPILPEGWYGTFLQIPSTRDDFIVASGVFSPGDTEGRSFGGVVLPICPLRRISIRRGQPLAKVIAFRAEAMKLRATYESCDGASDKEEAEG